MPELVSLPVGPSAQSSEPSQKQPVATSTGLVIMARAGDEHAKTRLASHLTEGERARLVRAMLEDELDTFARVKDARTLVACTPDPEHPMFVSLAATHDITLIPQREGALGIRLTRAALHGFRDGQRKVLLFGSDSPSLPVYLIEQAIAWLEQVDVVLGPAFDGGYYLIGMNRLEPALFTNIRWSSPSVLSETAQRADECGLSVGILPFWYDIDESDDIARFIHHMRATAHIHRGARMAGRYTLKALLRNKGRG